MYINIYIIYILYIEYYMLYILYIIHINIHYIYLFIYALLMLYIHVTPHFLGELRKLPSPALCKRGGSNYIKMLVINLNHNQPLHIFKQQVTIEVLLLKAIFIIRILDLANFL